MLSNLINTSGWSHEQWLAACILAFAVLSIAVVMHRMLKLFRMTKKSSYQPNLRPLRRRRLQAADKSEQQDE